MRIAKREHEDKMREALIAGGGIGGLTAALCLHAHGWDVTVLEKAPDLAEVGAGLQLSPNAMKVFEALGLDGTLAATGFTPDGIEAIADIAAGKAVVVVDDEVRMVELVTDYLREAGFTVLCYTPRQLIDHPTRFLTDLISTISARQKAARSA